MKLLGTPPINPVLFLIWKAALVLPFLFLPLAAVHHAQGRLAFPRASPFALAAVIVGVELVLWAGRELGASIRVGLPNEATVFKTHGLYRYSRNPIYVGVFVALAGSCVLVPHWLNLTSTSTAVIVHHLIVLGEERFLDARFGTAWREYRSHVRRYL